MEERTIVEALRPLISNVGHDLLDLTIRVHTLDVDMCEPQHGTGRRVVRSTALQSNEARFDNVDSSNAVTSGNVVQGLEELKRAADCLTAFNLELDKDS